MIESLEPFWLLQMDTEAVVAVGGIVAGMGLAVAAMYRDSRTDKALTVALLRELNAHLNLQNAMLARRLGDKEADNDAA